MGTISRVPRHYATIPRPIFDSLLIDDDLRPQREEAKRILTACEDIYRGFEENGAHPLVTPETAAWVLKRTDQTTLMQNRIENSAWMERITDSAIGPVHARGVCSYFNKLAPVAKILTAHPEEKIACVIAYPTGKTTPERIRAEIKAFHEGTKHLPNEREIDPVIDIEAWMNGNVAHVEDILKEIKAACDEYNLTWKGIISAGSHAHAGKNTLYGADYFKSVYDVTKLVLKYGGNPKTSTGQAAPEPFHYFNPKDVGHIAAALPMMIATRDFNHTQGTAHWCKFSGGHESELDAAVFRHAVENIFQNQSEVIKNTAFGANFLFQKRIIEYLYTSGYTNPETGLTIPREAVMPKDFNPDHIPDYLGGMADPRDFPGAPPAPAPEGTILAL